MWFGFVGEKRKRKLNERKLHEWVEHILKYGHILTFFFAELSRKFEFLNNNDALQQREKERQLCQYSTYCVVVVVVLGMRMSCVILVEFEICFATFTVRKSSASLWL